MTSRSTVLWALFALQAICCSYFLIDIVFDLVNPAAVDPTTGWAAFADSDLVEGAVTIALFLGLAFSGSELLKLMRHQAHMDDQLKIASGAFSELLETRFHQWSLTDAERDVAILAIKGFAIADMADIRNTKQGTIKAQCASVYRKAGVSGRLELLSLFLEDLMAEDLIPAPVTA